MQQQEDLYQQFLRETRGGRGGRGGNATLPDPGPDLYSQFQADQRRASDSAEHAPYVPPPSTGGSSRSWGDEDEYTPSVSRSADVAAQAFAGPANLVTTAGEGLLRLGSLAYKNARGLIDPAIVPHDDGPNALDRGADALRQRRNQVNEILEPSTGSGRAANVASHIFANALPAIATGGTYGVLAGGTASAGLTGVQSMAGRDASITGLVGDLTESPTINKLADNPVTRTALDMALDVGLSAGAEKAAKGIATFRANRAAAKAATREAELGAAKIGVETPHAEGLGPVERAVESADDATSDLYQQFKADTATPSRKPLTVPIEEPLGGVTGGRTASDIGEAGRDGGVSVPLMMTNKMRADLRARGFSPEDIANMKPEDAHAALGQPGPVRQPSVSDLDRARMQGGEMPTDPAVRSQVEGVYEQLQRHAGFEMTADDVLGVAESKLVSVPEAAERLRKAGYTVTDDMVREAKKSAMRKLAPDPASLPARDKFGNLVESFDDQRNAMLAETDREAAESAKRSGSPLDLDRSRVGGNDLPPDVASAYGRMKRIAKEGVTAGDIANLAKSKGITISQAAEQMRQMSFDVPPTLEAEATALASGQRRGGTGPKLVQDDRAIAGSKPAAKQPPLSRADRIIVNGEGTPAVRADDGQVYSRKQHAEHGDLMHMAEMNDGATFDKPEADYRGWLLDGKFVSVRDLDSETIEGVHYTRPASRTERPPVTIPKSLSLDDEADGIAGSIASERPTPAGRVPTRTTDPAFYPSLDSDRELERTPAKDLFKSVSYVLKQGDRAKAEDHEYLRLLTRELARRAGIEPEDVVEMRLRALKLDPATRAARMRALSEAGVFHDAPHSAAPSGVFEIDDPKFGKGAYWQTAEGQRSPTRFPSRNETFDDVVQFMHDEFHSLPASERAPSGMRVVPGGAADAAESGLAAGIRSAAGRLPKNLKPFSQEQLEHEWARLVEQNSAEEARHAAIQESGYRADYEELPRTEKLGRKGREDLPDADGTIAGERLAADNKAVSDFRKASMVRAAREKAMARIEAELARRGVSFGEALGDADPEGFTPFSNPMFDPRMVRRALATRYGQSAALGGVGLSLEQSDDEKLQATGRGLMGLAALHAVGASRIRATGGYVGGRAVEALRGSPMGQRVLNTISKDILADPKVRAVIDAYDEGVAGARARAAELSKQARSLGPSGDRAVSDIIEKESFEPLTTDQTAAMAVAQRISDEFTALGRAKVGAGLLSAETVAKREGKYLPRMFGEHLGESAQLDPRQHVFESTKRPVRIRGEMMRDDDLTVEARNALGEIREASFRTAAGIEKGYRDVAAAKLFDSLREMQGVVHPEFAEAVDGLRAAKQSGDKAAIEEAKNQIAAMSARYGKGRDGFRRLPDTPGMGVLRGAIVRADVADYLDGVETLPGKAGDLLTAWKRIHTTLNPGTHVGNVISNSVIAHMVGLPLWKQPAELSQALGDFNAYGPTTKFLAEKGILSHGLPTASEGVPAAGRSLKTSLTQLSETTRPATASVLAEKGIKPKAAPFRAVGHVAAKMEQAYAKEDAVFRVAVFNKLTREGMHSDDAAQLVDRAFVNYTTRSPLLGVIKNTVSPFVMYPVRAIPFITEQIIEHPWRWTTLAALWGGMDQVAQARVGKIAQEDLRPSDRTNPNLGYLAPGFMQLPFKSAKGDKYGVNIERFTPFSALAGAAAPGTTVSAAFGKNVPPILQPSGPISDVVARGMLNRDPYSGDKLIKPGDGPREKLGALGSSIASLALPSALSFHLPRVASDLRDREPGRAAVDALGLVGLRPAAVRPGVQQYMDQRDFEEARAQILHDLRAKLRTVRDPARVEALKHRAEERLRELARNRKSQIGQ